MSKILSSYLKQEFDLSLIEKQEGDRVLQIIPHDALEDIVHNQINAEQGVTYDYRIESADVNHSVVICVIADKSGRRIVGIGESIPETLDSTIAKTYPTLMATQRAFDRAVIRYLALPGKAFSNTEIAVDAGEDKPKEDNSKGIQSSPVKEIKKEEAPKPAPIHKQDDVKPKEKEQEEKQPGDVIMRAGSEKNKLTVAQAFEKNISSVAWVRKNIKPSKPEYKETLEAINGYLAESDSAKAIYEKFLEEHPEFKIAA